MCLAFRPCTGRINDNHIVRGKLLIFQGRFKEISINRPYRPLGFLCSSLKRSKRGLVHFIPVNRRITGQRERKRSPSTEQICDFKGGFWQKTTNNRGQVLIRFCASNWNPW